MKFYILQFLFLSFFVYNCNASIWDFLFPSTSQTSVNLPPQQQQPQPQLQSAHSALPPPNSAPVLPASRGITGQNQHQNQNNNQNTANHRNNNQNTAFRGENSANVAASVLNFAQNVGKQLLQQQPKSKIEIFSPLSLMSALAMVLLGAKNRSYAEVARLFGIEQTPGKLHQEFGQLLQELVQPPTKVSSTRRPKEHIVHIANGLFTQHDYSINPDYREVLISLYNTDLMQLDFKRQAAQSRSYINDWVNHNTYGKIPSIIEGTIERDTNVILASALYFKAFWHTQFLEYATKLENFYPNGVQAKPVKVKMMATTGNFPYYNASEYGCQIIGLPYEGDLSTMYIIQPQESSSARLRQLQSELDAAHIDDMISKMSKHRTNILFPKLHVTRSINNMKQILQNMGVRDIFVRGVADLSLISSNEPATTGGSRSADSLSNLEEARHTGAGAPPMTDLFVDDIVHKVDFDVNEQGTEAAAATAVIMRKTGPEIVFRADTPFLILLRHDPTKLVLFYGIVNQPTA